ncbi:uncharacterized protein J3D65DRAFT_268257 [Phyllosticta citribraziliensis]|uniref:Uncharacterized protein n=1 Tax=Phyllosticta citribraziliensis TaxID=989973 RepID=A0ABR1M112_9PEZI
MDRGSTEVKDGGRRRRRVGDGRGRVESKGRRKGAWSRASRSIYGVSVVEVLWEPVTESSAKLLNMPWKCAQTRAGAKGDATANRTAATHHHIDHSASPLSSRPAQLASIHRSRTGTGTGTAPSMFSSARSRPASRFGCTASGGERLRDDLSPRLQLQCCDATCRCSPLWCQLQAGRRLFCSNSRPFFSPAMSCSGPIHLGPRQPRYPYVHSPTVAPSLVAFVPVKEWMPSRFPTSWFQHMGRFLALL